MTLILSEGDKHKQREEEEEEEEEEDTGGGGADNDSGEKREEREKKHERECVEGGGEEENVKEKEGEEEEENVSKMSKNGVMPVHVPDVKSSTPPVMEVKGAGHDAENKDTCVRNRHGKAKHLKANDHVATRSRWKLVSLDNGVRVFQVRAESLVSGHIHKHTYIDRYIRTLCMIHI